LGKTTALGGGRGGKSKCTENYDRSRVLKGICDRADLVV